MKVITVGNIDTRAAIESAVKDTQPVSIVEAEEERERGFTFVIKPCHELITYMPTISKSKHWQARRLRFLARRKKTVFLN